MVALNEQLLNAASGSWFSPPTSQFETGSDQVETLVTNVSAHSPWLLKDPRMVLTWPVWSAALADAVAVFVYRSPLSVATSLQRRHGFPLEFGLALWELYNRTVLCILQQRSSQGLRHVAVSYDAFVTDPGAAWERLENDLQHVGVSVAGASNVDFFEEKLNHATESGADPQRLSASQAALHGQCKSICAGEEVDKIPAATPGLDQILKENAGAFGALAELASLQASSTTLLAERDKARNDYADLNARYTDLGARNESLQLAHKRDGEELEFVRDERQRWQQQLDDVQQDLVARNAAIESLEQSERGLQAQVTALQGRINDSEELQRETQAKADYLFHQLDNAYLKLLQYANSVPGRLAGFSTALYKLLTLRRSVNTAYQDLQEDAQEHLANYGSTVPAAAPGRIRLGFSILAYVLRHPSASMRSFSRHRLRRALGVFLGSNNDDLELWVRQRFPEVENSTFEDVQPDLPDALDELELDFPVCEKPLVSIVIPVYNEYRMTVYCLRSLLDHLADVPCQVIIADDASTDLTASLQERIFGVTVERAAENRGFLQNCNAGAELATGDYILFLNNDTAFTPGWLSALIDVFEQDSQAGIAGPMLLYGNGRLQEAGGIVWDDASGWNYGRMDDPSRPEYCYRREADYVSGACLLIRAGLWRELGGFDERYVPAYYEDTDLCFAARAAGYKVVYQPHSRIYHFEGISHGTDLNAGIKQHQVVNAERFLEKWRVVLQAEHLPNGEQVFHARDRSWTRRTVLVVDHYVPSYDKDAGSRSTWQYLQLMVDMGYNVKFIGANFFPHQPYTRELQAMGVEVLVGEGMARNLDTWLAEHASSIDTVYIHRPHVAEQLVGSFLALRPRPKLIFFGHDLHFLRVEREFELTGDAGLKAQATQWKDRELAVFSQVDKVYYPSQVEVEVVRGVAPQTDVRAIPLYVLQDSAGTQYQWSERSDILFVGGFNHPPNVDGLCWFVDEVMPLVWEQCPQLKLHVVGSSAPVVVQSLAQDRVLIHGYLSDEELAKQYLRARMVAVPLRFGAGVKGKVLEALQNEVPLVTTSIGAEGLPEADLVFNICDEARDFADALVDLERGDSARMELRSHYREYLERHFSKRRAADLLCSDFGEPSIERECS